MKEVLQQEKGEKIEISIEKQEKKTIKHLNSIRHLKGLKLWEFNEATGELAEAEYHKENLVIDDFSGTSNASTLRKRVNIKPSCVYFQALNRKSALKKIRKANQSH
jgi:hypothetical protein